MALQTTTWYYFCLGFYPFAKPVFTWWWACNKASPPGKTTSKMYRMRGANLQSIDGGAEDRTFAWYTCTLYHDFWGFWGLSRERTGGIHVMHGELQSSHPLCLLAKDRWVVDRWLNWWIDLWMDETCVIFFFLLHTVPIISHQTKRNICIFQDYNILYSLKLESGLPYSRFSMIFVYPWIE